MANEHYKKPDFWARKAKDEGYPARSVYKLMEIQEKFRLLRPGYTVLDLGAAPGSWSQYLAELCGPSGFLVAVDLSPIQIKAKHPNSLLLRGDIFSPDIRAAILEKAPYDAVLCDAAPATSGNSIVDSGRSAALVEAAIDYARVALRQGGCLVTKIFQGGQERGFIDQLKVDFREARGFKPKACRAESFETYLVAQGRK